MEASARSTATGVRSPPAPAQLVQAGTVGLITGLVFTVAVRLVVEGLFAVDPSIQPFQWLPTVGAVIAFGIAATGVYFVLGRFTARPRRNFLVVSTLTFALMLVPALTVSPSVGVTGGLVWALVGLHAAAAVGIAGGLLGTLARL